MEFNGSLFNENTVERANSSVHSTECARVWLAAMIAPMLSAGVELISCWVRMESEEWKNQLAGSKRRCFRWLRNAVERSQALFINGRTLWAGHCVSDLSGRLINRPVTHLRLSENRFSHSPVRESACELAHSAETQTLLVGPKWVSWPKEVHSPGRRQRH